MSVRRSRAAHSRAYGPEEAMIADIEDRVEDFSGHHSTGMPDEIPGLDDFLDRNELDDSDIDAMFIEEMEANG